MRRPWLTGGVDQTSPVAFSTRRSCLSAVAAVRHRVEEMRRPHAESLHCLGQRNLKGDHDQSSPSSTGIFEVLLLLLLVCCATSHFDAVLSMVKVCGGSARCNVPLELHHCDLGVVIPEDHSALGPCPDVRLRSVSSPPVEVLIGMTLSGE